MVGKKLVKNLKYYLDPLMTETVFLFDRHEERTLPCIIVGYSEENGSFPDPRGHYTVSGYVGVLFQGYDDLNNELADNASTQIVNALLCSTALLSTVNKPSFGTDMRPASAFNLNQLIIRGVEREDEEHSTIIMVNYDAFCVAIDR